jgi:cellulose synthase/poly-beta-1,6-N-acetylglucosamine synthase-like glycosyltransferase
MPVYNEVSFIGKSIDAILAQSYSAEKMEIIVADGGSTDGTFEMVKEIRASSPIPISIVDNPKRIAPSGLNRALEIAKGTIVIRVDGHCEVDNDYVTNCVKLLQSGNADGVGGPIETVGDSIQARAISLAMSSKFGVGNSAFRTTDNKQMYVDTVAFPGYTREIVDRAGAFDEELVRNQDDEYNFRIRKLGGRIMLSPDIRARYYSRSTFRSLWRQYFQYGYWKVRVLQLHPFQMSLRQFVPAAFVISLAFCLSLSFFFDFGRLLLLILAGSYGLANIAASIYISTGRDIRTLPYLPIGFGIIHFSYGLGFLTGLFTFRGRWRRRALI